MSFSSTLKTELCSLKSPECCRTAELYGMLIFGQSFKAEKISILSDTPAVISNFNYLIRKKFGFLCKSVNSEGKRPMYRSFLEKAKEREAVLDDFNKSFTPDSFFKKDCCRDAFLRGAFLVCGQIQDPEKEHRAEFRIKATKYTDIIESLLNERGIEFNKGYRQNSDIIYIKKSDSIEDLVTAMGASSLTLNLIDIKMIKELRNNINRKNNAEIFNTSKIIEASIEQRNAIKYLIENEKFEILSDELKEIALLRMANPEASLTELSRLASESITRSGLNHRLQKIMEIVKELKEKR